MRHREGHWVVVLDRGRVLTRTPDGKPEWMFGTHLDITERKRRDEALRKSEALLNRTGEVAGVGGWELDLDTGTLMWTAQTRAIHGVSSEYQPTLDGAIHFYDPMRARSSRQLSSVRSPRVTDGIWNCPSSGPTANGSGSAQSAMLTLLATSR